MTLVGTMFLIGGLFSAVAQMVAGGFSDRFGRRPLLLGAAGLGTLLFSGLMVLIGVSAPVWAIMVIYVAGRSVLTMMRPIISAIVADVSPNYRLMESYGLLRVGGNVGFAAGAALGGYLLAFVSYAWLFGVAALTSALIFLFILLFLRESFAGAGEEVDFRSILSVATNGTFLMFTGLCLFGFMGMGQLSTTLSIFTVDRMGFSTAQYGLLLTTNGLLVVLFQYPVARWIDQLRRSEGLVLGCLLYAFGYVSLGWITGFGWTLGAIALVTAGEITFTPLTLSVVAELSPNDRRGRYMGFFGLSQSLAMSFSPLMGGILLDAFPTDPRLIWGTIASVIFMAAVGFYWWGRWAASTRQA